MVAYSKQMTYLKRNRVQLWRPHLSLIWVLEATSTLFIDKAYQRITLIQVQQNKKKIIYKHL